MTEDERVHTRELIRGITVRDRRFRIAQTIFMMMIGVVLAGVVILEYYQIQHLQAQSAQRAAGINKILDDERDQNAKQTRYIQCIAQFFNTTDRTNRVLTDLDKCSILKNGEQVPGVDLTPTSSTSSSGSAARSDSTPSSTGSSGSTAPAGSGSGTTTPPVVTTPTVPSTPAAPDPVRVLGLPVCVPLTTVCVRQ